MIKIFPIISLETLKFVSRNDLIARYKIVQSDGQLVAEVK